MKNMNYQQAAAEAIKAFDNYRRNAIVKEIEKDAQFRKLTVYESCGRAEHLQSVLFGLEFCDKAGANYREVLISIALVKEMILRDVRLYTITNI